MDKNHHFQASFSLSFEIVWKSRCIVTHRAGLAVGGVVTAGRAARTLQHLDALLHEAGVGPDPPEQALHLGLAHSGVR